MIVVFRNFYRNKMVNLSARSIKYFYPDMKIYCLSLCKHDMSEYANQEPLLPFIEEFTAQTKYVNKENNNLDDVDTTKTSGFDADDNGAYFTEGYNLIFNRFKTSDEVVLMLAEDHYFTTGQTLKEIVDTTGQWDICYGDADSERAGYLRGNGSILGIVPSKVRHLFPMVEHLHTTIEWMVGNLLLRQLPEDRIHCLSTRKWYVNPNGLDNNGWPDYCGDGLYTNSSEVMIEDLKKAGII